MKRVKVNVKVKSDQAEKVMENKKRNIKFSSNNDEKSAITQTITNNYYSLQDTEPINENDFSQILMRDARRYSYSLEVKL